MSSAAVFPPLPFFFLIIDGKIGKLWFWDILLERITSFKVVKPWSSILNYCRDVTIQGEYLIQE